LAVARIIVLFIGQTPYVIGSAGYWSLFESLMEYVGLYIVAPVWLVSRFLIAGFHLPDAGQPSAWLPMGPTRVPVQRVLLPERRRWWDGILVVSARPERDGSVDWPRVPVWFTVGLLKTLLFFVWVFVVAPFYVAIGLPIYLLWRLTRYFTVVRRSGLHRPGRWRGLMTRVHTRTKA
jgi:hypothetical protein